MGAGASSQRLGEPGAVSLGREEVDVCRSASALEKLLLSRCPDLSDLRPVDSLHVLSHLATLTFTARSSVTDEPNPAGPLPTWDPRASLPAQRIASTLVPGLTTHVAIRGYRPRGVANLLWSLGVLHTARLLPASGTAAVTPDVLRTCEACLSPAILAALSPNDCANVLWGFAVLGHQPHSKFLSTWAAAWVGGLHAAAAPALHAQQQPDDVAPAQSGRVHPRAVSRALVACALLGDVAHVVGFEAFHAGLDALCGWVEDDGSGFVPPDVLASSLWALTALRVVPKPRVHGPLCSLCASSFTTCSRAELCRLLWGLASCGIQPSSGMLAALETHLADARHQLRTAAAPWRPRHGSEEARPRPHSQHGDDAAATAGATAGETAWEEATLLWSYASLGISPPPAAMDARCERCVSAAELAVGAHPPGAGGSSSVAGVCDSLQHLLWALGRLRHRPQRGALLVRLADVLAPRMQVLGAGGIGGVVFAYAQLGASPGADVLAKSADWWRDALRRGTVLGHSGGALALCHTLFGWATLGYHPGEHVLDAAAKALLASHPASPSGDGANINGSGYNDDGPLAHLPPGGLCCALFAYGTWTHVPATSPGPGFLPAAAQAVALHAAGCTLRELSHAVWALANLAHHPGRPWLDSIAPAVVAAVSGASQELGPASPTLCSDVAHLLWGLLVLRDHSRSTSSGAALKGARLASNAGQSDVSSATLAAWLALSSLADDGVANDPFSLRVLLTAELLLQSEAPGLARAYAARNAVLTPHRAQRRGNWRSSAVAAWKASAVHSVESILKHPAYADICATLAMLRVPHTPARVSADHMLCLDVMIRTEELLSQDQLVTCLSLDGQPAFLRTTGSKASAALAPTGATLLRDRVYEALRVRCVSLPLPLWATASKTRGERQREDARAAVLTRVLGKLYA